ncbi:MAG TPA: TIGR00730 family Rossman fold protein [Moheibacter sp.]|nr:TIGR00730 family Rossman fold protein [Moheibacter sp.]
MHKEEDSHRIREKLVPKNWNEVKSNDSWALFKIMAEFVKGYEIMAKTGPCVSVFGSARTPADSKYYQMAEEIGYQLTQLGFGVITGGGPGIMEAANKGAQRGKGKSVGLGISLPFETGLNPYVDRDFSINFDYFFARKVMFVKYAQGFIALPGGLGTLDELFESLTLVQTKKTGRFPIVLVGKDYWSGLLDWLKEKVRGENYISEEDFDLYRIVDTPEEAVAHIKAFYDKYMLKQNF